MHHRTGRPPGPARALVQAAALLLTCFAHLLVPTLPAPLPRPALRIAGAEIPVPRHLLNRRRTTHRPPTPLAARVRPYLLAHEQRMRRRALVLALDGIDVGPEVIHGHRVGTRVKVAA